MNTIINSTESQILRKILLVSKRPIILFVFMIAVTMYSRKTMMQYKIAFFHLIYRVSTISREVIKKI